MWEIKKQAQIHEGKHEITASAGANYKAKKKPGFDFFLPVPTPWAAAMFPAVGRLGGFCGRCGCTSR